MEIAENPYEKLSKSCRRGAHHEPAALQDAVAVDAQLVHAEILQQEAGPQGFKAEIGGTPTQMPSKTHETAHKSHEKP